MLQFSLELRYGREDEELMGLQFCNEMIIANQRIYPVDPEQVGYICILYILSEVPGVVRGIQKKFEF